MWSFVVTEDGIYDYEINSKYQGGIIHEIKDSTLYITEKVISLHRFLRSLGFLLGLNKHSISIYVPRDAKV